MNLLSRIARRFVTPHDAASIVSKHGAAKRAREALTLAEKKAATTAELRAWVAANRSQA